jgi:hypothetical protein
VNKDLYASELTDVALREEIELIGALVVAASAAGGRMGTSEIDVVLGVHV